VFHETTEINMVDFCSRKIKWYHSWNLVPKLVILFQQHFFGRVGSPCLREGGFSKPLWQNGCPLLLSLNHQCTLFIGNMEHNETFAEFGAVTWVVSIRVDPSITTTTSVS
jgi:hypothetical protein